MNLYAEHESGFGELVSLMGSDCPVFTWANSEWKIIPNTAVFRKPLDIGGFTLNSDLRFWTLLDQFQANGINDIINSLQDTSMAYLGADYKITGVSIAPGGLHAIIEANALNQRA